MSGVLVTRTKSSQRMGVCRDRFRGFLGANSRVNSGGLARREYQIAGATVPWNISHELKYLWIHSTTVSGKETTEEKQGEGNGMPGTKTDKTTYVDKEMDQVSVQ